MLDYKTIVIKHFGGGMTGRELSEQGLGSKSGINEFLSAFKACPKIGYPLPEGITNYGIAELVYGAPNLPHNSGRNEAFAYPDYPEIHNSLDTHKNMTLIYLWNRYSQRCEEEGRKAYSYRQFCANYDQWCSENAETMHLQAVIGQKMEVDFAGKTFRMADPDTGENCEIVVFVAILPYSQYIYAEGMLSTKETQWIAVNNHALRYFGGVPAIVVCDNCKQAVTANTDWIDPNLNKDYAEWAEHNHTVIMPAKVRKPKMKSSVENAVGILESGCFHTLGEKPYFSLEQFNNDLWDELEKINHAPFKKKPNNRYYYWMEEKDELMPLPEAEYEYMERKVVKVSSDYHIRFGNSYYSVDKAYLHRQVIVAATAGKVHITSMEGQLLAEWPRAQYHGQWYTNPQHLPANLNEMAEWNSAYFVRKAMTIGPNTTEVIKQVLKCRQLEVQTYRMCQGILGFSARYSKQALEMCCKRALELKKVTYTTIKNTIPACAEELGKAGYASRINEERNAGAFVMSSEASDIERLLSRSRDLAAGQKGGVDHDRQ